MSNLEIRFAKKIGGMTICQKKLLVWNGGKKNIIL